MPGNADKLDRIFGLQKAFDDELARRRGLDYSDAADWMRKGALALIVETGELLSELNYKWWKDARPLDYEKIRGELADILHFFISVCIKAGLDADTLAELYAGKNRENFDRQSGESERSGEGYKS